MLIYRFIYSATRYRYMAMGTQTAGIGTVLWTPQVQFPDTRMGQFSKFVSKNLNLPIEFCDYASLYQWSVEHHLVFWEQLWKWSRLLHSVPPSATIQSQGDDPPERLTPADRPEWFPGARLNFAENILLRAGKEDAPAVYSVMEGGLNISCLTYGQLRTRVAQYAAALRSAGVVPGDRVAAYMPNCPAVLEAMLATAAVGAVWSSTSPDFGYTGVLDRFTQISPKILFSVHAVRYNSKVHNHVTKLNAVIKGLPELEKVVMVPFLAESEYQKDETPIPKSCLLEEFLTSGQNSDGTTPEIQFEQLPFSHPLTVLYSSGTTGAPKCMVHSAGGILLQHIKEHDLHVGMTEDDVFIYHTTTGWMMWNWLISGLASGSAIVLYDGSPLIPTANVTWDLVDKLGITILGTSAKWLAIVQEKDIKPKLTHKLTSLRAILSTASPLKPSSFDYVYENIKSDLMLGSITGGTDIMSLFAGCNPALQVRRGEIQCRTLGMAVECWLDENFDDIGDSKPVAVVDQPGELICAKPFPVQPINFWNDTDGSKYYSAYFSRFPKSGVWAHGDFCQLSSKSGGIHMMGRSDGTLNPSGVRFGSAEIYNIVEDFKEISDSLCVAQSSFLQPGEERVILFLMTSEEAAPVDAALVHRVKTAIRSRLSARHVPAFILPISDIPYTQNGKKVEIAVRRAMAGQTVVNKNSLRNPECLELYKDIPELQGY